MGSIGARHGGGKFKVDFRHDTRFVGTRNFWPEGQPDAERLPRAPGAGSLAWAWVVI